MADKKEPQKKEPPKTRFAEVPMETEDHEIVVGLKETIFIAVGTALVTVATATAIHAFRERSKRKTYKSLADSIGGLVSKFIEVEVPAPRGQIQAPVQQKRITAGRGNK